MTQPIQDTSPSVDGEALFQRSPREGGYQFVVCPKFPGFSLMLRPAEDDTALNAAFVSFIAAEVAALAPPSSKAGEDRPHLIDNDLGEITVTLNGKELRGWSYKDDAERRTKMLAAREYVEGWCDGRDACQK